MSDGAGGSNYGDQDLQKRLDYPDQSVEDEIQEEDRPPIFAPPRQPELLQKSRSAKDLIRIFVQQMNGDRLVAMKVGPDHTVKDIVKAIGHAAGVQAPLLLAFQSRVLDERGRVKEVGLRDGSSLTAIRYPELFVAVAHEDGSVALWSAETGQRERLVQGNRGAVLAVAFSPNGTMIVSGCMDGTLSLWNVATGVREALFQGHRGPVMTVACCPDGVTVASGSLDRSVKLWEMHTGANICSLPGHGGPIGAVVFSPDGGYLASAAADNTAKLWHVSRRHCLATFEGHRMALTSVAFSQYGTVLATGSADASVRIWATESTQENKGKCWRRLKGHKGAVRSVSFLPPQGELLAVGVADGSAMLWDVRNAICVRAIGSHSGPELRSLAVSPAGSLIAMGSEDGSVQLWKTESAQQCLRLPGHASAVHQVAFSAGLGPTGKRTALPSDSQPGSQQRSGSRVPSQQGPPSKQRHAHEEGEKQKTLAISRSEPQMRLPSLPGSSAQSQRPPSSPKPPPAIPTVSGTGLPSNVFFGASR
ncbi:unnamed protein product [Polarella glacialis]|uniref:Ubiquitin-like domain-containing protein n=1 Tax=Polarella glacialis TaxID=89957 RepID=A0A813J427_POLGL|nr:unnamed protein product [Polarella glacialis]CAE8662100.1 unnamed protein product [Polarella glacialis]